MMTYIQCVDSCWFFSLSLSVWSLCFPEKSYATQRQVSKRTSAPTARTPMDLSWTLQVLQLALAPASMGMKLKLEMNLRTCPWATWQLRPYRTVSPEEWIWGLMANCSRITMAILLKNQVAMFGFLWEIRHFSTEFFSTRPFIRGLSGPYQIPTCWPSFWVSFNTAILNTSQYRRTFPSPNANRLVTHMMCFLGWLAGFSVFFPTFRLQARQW